MSSNKEFAIANFISEDCDVVDINIINPANVVASVNMPINTPIPLFFIRSRPSVWREARPPEQRNNL